MARGKGRRAPFPVEHSESSSVPQPQYHPPPPHAPVPPPPPAPPAAAPVVGMDPAIFAQMMQGFLHTQQLQATMLQTLMERGQAPVAPHPVAPPGPRVGTLKDYNSFHPPTFYGNEDPEDADAWLQMTQKLLVASHIPEEDMVNAAQTKMDKIAGAWITAEMAMRGQVMAWDDFKEVFRQRFFPPSTQRKMVQRFLELTQGNKSISSYAHKFELLSQYATGILPDEASRVERFLQGLRGQLKGLVRACRPTTLLEAHQHALQMEQDTGGVKDGQSYSHKRPVGQFNKGGSQAPAKTARTASHAYPASSAGSVTYRSGAQVTCFGCGKKGHKANECWKLLGKCVGCGSTGHQTGNCPARGNRNMQTPTAPQPTSSVAKGKAPAIPTTRSAMGLGRGAAPVQGKAPLPTQSTEYAQFRGNRGRRNRGVFAMAAESEPAGEIITGIISLYNIPAIALFDSGASSSFIAAQFVSYHGLLTTTLDAPISYGTGHGQVVVQDFVRKCPLRIKDRILEADLLVLPLPFMDVILGMDWLSRGYAHIDYH